LASPRWKIGVDFFVREFGDIGSPPIQVSRPSL
jgi:hypothetical protein